MIRNHAPCPDIVQQRRLPQAKPFVQPRLPLLEPCRSAPSARPAALLKLSQHVLPSPPTWNTPAPHAEVEQRKPSQRSQPHFQRERFLPAVVVVPGGAHA